MYSDTEKFHFSAYFYTDIKIFIVASPLLPTQLFFNLNSVNIIWSAYGIELQVPPQYPH